MKVNINGEILEVDVLEVGKRYKHIPSDTLWFIDHMEDTMMGTAIHGELVNKYGDIGELNCNIMMKPIIANKGKFVEITKQEFEDRKNM